MTGVQQRIHAPHSPSSLENKAKCPGFRNDQSGDKSAANRGEFLHECVEKETAALPPPPGVEHDDFSTKAVELCIAYSKSLSTGEVHKEARLEMLDQWGYADLIIIHKDSADLVDYKFAWNHYPSEGMQFKAYTLGIINRWPQVKKVRIHVLHPFIDIIDTCEYSEEQFTALGEEVGATIALAKKNNPADFRTGAQCAYCGVAGSCPKLGGMATAISTRFNPTELVIPDELTPENINDPRIVAQGLVIAPIMEKWCSQMKKRALQLRLEEGVEIPGFDLCERASAFSITDAAAAWAAVKDKVSPEEYATCVDVKIGDLEKVFASKFGRGEKGAAKAKLRDLLTDMDAAKSEGVVHFLKRQKPQLTDETN